MVSKYMVAGMLIKHFLMVHYNIVFNSKGSEDRAAKVTENCWFCSLHCHLRTSSRKLSDIATQIFCHIVFDIIEENVL